MVQTDERVALDVLKAAAKDTSVLLVLDDVWVAAHATPLNFIHGSALRSAVVITTRVRSLLDGAVEVQCGVLDKEASLELLLRAGGCEQMLDDPPPAAFEAVELCGRLPLTLAIAGGMVADNGQMFTEDILDVMQDKQELEDEEGMTVELSLIHI